MSFLLVPPAAFLLALAFLGDVGGQAVGTAAVLAVASTAWALLVGRDPSRDFRFTRAHLGPWARAVATTPGKVGRTGLILARTALAGGAPGRAVAAPFQAGLADDPSDRARRATAVLTASLAPDSFVVTAESGRDALLHAVTATPPPADPRWLQ